MLTIPTLPDREDRYARLNGLSHSFALTGEFGCGRSELNRLSPDYETGEIPFLYAAKNKNTIGTASCGRRNGEISVLGPNPSRSCCCDNYNTSQPCQYNFIKIFRTALIFLNFAFFYCVLRSVVIIVVEITTGATDMNALTTIEGEIVSAPGDLAPTPALKPGIYEGIPNEDYHRAPGISKSGLWTIHTKTPAHYKYPPIKEETTQSKAIKDFGNGCHLAILEPELFEKKAMRGPSDRRGNKWTDLVEACALDGKLLLVSDAYDNILALRDAVHADPFINGIITGGKPLVEASGAFIDPATGELCRVRPDLYREDLGLILDVKSTESARPDAFARSVINYGYHAQEAFYSDGWSALGKPVNGWAFLTFEKKSPYATAVYELPPSIVEEGRAAMRQAMETYHECRVKGQWPGYASGVQELTFKHWQYLLTQAPTDEGEAE